MTALIICFPQTAGGRDCLREALADVKTADTRLYLATEFDWDESAVELRRWGIAPEPASRREAW
jgi:hypothetical protein